ncbi:MAG: hypothetical protein H0T73_21455 [Ardenticatenales bacterium]|nr:hypothetical protein [Ardenticatenales bacterium]
MTTLRTLSLFELISNAPSQRLAEFEKGVMASDLFEELGLEFETTVSSLATMSYEMEKQALEQNVCSGAIYVGFQRLSRFTPSVAGRYLQMARAQHRVYVFGVPDVAPTLSHERLHYVELDPSDRNQPAASSRA